MLNRRKQQQKSRRRTPQYQQHPLKKQYAAAAAVVERVDSRSIGSRDSVRGDFDHNHRQRGVRGCIIVTAEREAKRDKKNVSRERSWKRTSNRAKNELAKEAKDRGAMGATDEAEEEGGARSNSTEDSGEHREENVDE